MVKADPGHHSAAAQATLEAARTTTYAADVAAGSAEAVAAHGTAATAVELNVDMPQRRLEQAGYPNRSSRSPWASGPTGLACGSMQHQRG